MPREEDPAPTTEIRIGTSGYSYKAWRGAFYPEKLKDAEMLAFYAVALPAVEINNTFYRMPAAEMLRAVGRGDAARVHVRPEGAAAHHPPQAARRRVGEVSYFLSVASSLGDKLGPVLYQTPAT